MLSSRAARLWTGFGLLALVCALGLSRIGWWQLERAQSKQALLDGIEAASHAPLIALSELEVSGADAHFRAVTVEGEFRADRQMLLDNQLQQGRPGVRAYVPFQRGCRFPPRAGRSRLAGMRPDRSHTGLAQLPTFRRARWS
jgi:cytochrome oxidase assembly protein ShyY1